MPPATQQVRPSRRRSRLLLAVLVGLTVATVPGTASAVGPQTWTFDSEPVGAVPARCAPTGTAVGAVVSDERGHDSPQSLRVRDDSTSRPTQIACGDGEQRTGARLTFQAYPAALPNGFVFSLVGHRVGYADPDAVYHFHVPGDGSVRWYDGVAWSPLAGAGTVPVGRWTAITVDVPSDRERAHLSVGGTPVGEAGIWGVAEVADLTGFQFGSAGSGPVGDDVFVDSVVYADSTEPEPTRANPITVGPRTLVDESDEIAAMPGTAVNVPDAAGTRTMVGYSAHADHSAARGWGISSSTDGGATWFRDQGRNPDPTVASMNITKLRNGDLLALNYHTYLVEGTGDRQAQIPGAISHDNGRTWTPRTSVMTTPQVMRPISPTTDWPGHRLGGFVLMHTAMELGDGTLVHSAYGYYEGDPKYRSLLLASTDGGVTWTVRSTVAVDPNLSTNPRYEGFCEAAISVVADGSLLAVMRTGSYQPMYAARSRDGGRTWSAAQPLTTGDGQTVTGVNPQMQLLPGGVLVLQIGRPGMSIMTSPDGSGHTWRAPDTIDYRNSGNGRFQIMGPDRLLSFGDDGAEWSRYRTGPFRIWARSVSVDPLCARTVTGTVRGPLRVDAAGVCVVGATVDGPVQVQPGGRLVLIDTRVAGPVQGTRPDLVTVCGSTIGGPVQVSGARGAVMIGDKTRSCAANAVHGPVEVADNEGLVVVDNIPERAA